MARPRQEAQVVIACECNPCAVYTAVKLGVMGLDPSEPRGMVAVTIDGGNRTFAGINIDSKGVSDFYWYMNPAGTYTFEIYQDDRKKLVFKGSLEGIVVQ